MKNLSAFIVRNRIIFLIVFIALMIAGIIGSFFVKINYDLNKYLPENSEISKGMNILKEEFGESSNLLIMATDITKDEAFELKNKFFNTDGVFSVLFESEDETYYKDNNALFILTLEESEYSEKTFQTIEQITTYGDFYYTGQGVAIYNAKITTEKEIFSASIILIPIVLLILFLASTSFIEPFIFLLIIGVSVILNMGTNLIFGEVSFLTSGMASLLQLALSMDYSIILMHSYKAEKQSGKPSKEAMKDALAKSFTPVSSSSLTTLAGFLALLFMSFTIGTDLGLVLGKGIILSLLTVFLFMPAVVLTLDSLTVKTAYSFKKLKNTTVKEKAKSGYFDFLKKTRFIIPVILILILVPAYIFQSGNSFIYGNPMSDNDNIKISSVFKNYNYCIILLPLDEQENELPLSLNLIQDSTIDSVTSYSLIKENLKLQYGEYFDESMITDDIKAQFISKNYSRIIINLNTSTESVEAFNAANNIEKIVSSFSENSYILGETQSTSEIKSITVKDYKLVNILTVVFIVLILLFTFRSLTLPLIMIALIQGSFWLNMAIPYLIGEKIVFLGYIIVSCIQLGATIDYAILLTDNYKKNRKLYDKYGAVKTALKQSFRAILTSGSILCSAGFILGLTSSLKATNIIGMALGRGALASVILVLFILPQLLIIFDKPVKFTTLKAKKEWLK
jgi:hypothetical protein